MKVNFLYKIVMLIVVVTFNIFQIQAQTHGNGAITCTGCNPSGSTGGCTNTFIGSASGSSNTVSGTDNSFFGDHAGTSNTTGTDNTALGYQSLYTNADNNYSTAIGSQALYSFTGKQNPATAVGWRALYNLSSGADNTGVGSSSLFSATTSNDNSALGFDALYFNSTGSQNCAIGSYAGYGVTGDSHSYNTFMGYYSGYGITTGTYNTLLGWKSGVSNTTGEYNTEVGAASGAYLTTGNENTNLGYFAGYVNTISNDNTMVGGQAGFSNTSANNTFVGVGAGYSNTSNGNNSAFGMFAGYNSTGGNNTCLGYMAGFDNTTGADNIYVGYDATTSANNYSNDVVIGYSIAASTSNQVLLGNGSTTNLTCFGAKTTVTSYGALCVNSNGQIGIPSSSKRYKKDIVSLEINTSLLYKLRPVSFTYKSDGTRSFGLIAEEVDKVLPELVLYKKAKDVIPDSKSDEMIPDAVHYESLPVLLLAELQKQHSKIDSLESQLKQVKSLVNESISTGKLSGVQGETGTTMQLQLANNVVLYQNEPNPFGESTVIRYYVPDNLSGNAFIVFYDTYGKEIKKTEITSKGKGQINTDTQNLTSGIYSYSLVVDGVIKDTKKMVKE
ncbi:MAG: tail fiber domain-containing protein [Bacteroidales bacterium]|jgi:hypothetical protein